MLIVKKFLVNTKTKICREILKKLIKEITVVYFFFKNPLYSRTIFVYRYIPEIINYVVFVSIIN